MAPGGEPAAPDPGSTATRENGQRLGLRFRRGSRGPMRAADIPLVGVVRIDPFLEPEQSAILADVRPVETDAEAIPKEKRPRAARPRRKRTTAAPAQSTPAEGEESATPAPPKRPRARPRKKAE
jgi:hypothetical protein